MSDIELDHLENLLDGDKYKIKTRESKRSKLINFGKIMEILIFKNLPFNR